MLRAVPCLIASGLIACGGGRTRDVDEGGRDAAIHAPAAYQLVIESPPPFISGDGGQLRLAARVQPAGQALPAAWYQRWTVTDDTGALRRTWFETSEVHAQNPRAIAHWDGYDDEGERLAAGRYTLRLELLARDGNKAGAEPAVLARAEAAELTLLPADLASSTVCRLLGRDYHNPMTLQPELRFLGTDMGIPVTIGGQTYLLFGDSWTRDLCEGFEQPYLELRSDDVLGRVVMDPAPDPDECLGIELPVMADDPGLFEPITLHHQGKQVPLQDLAVVGAAFAYEDRLYALFNPYYDVVCTTSAECVEGATCTLGLCVYEWLPVFPPRLLAVSDVVDGHPGGHFTGLAEFSQPQFTNLAAHTVNVFDLDDPSANDYENDAPAELLVYGRSNFFSGIDRQLPLPPLPTYLFRQPIAPLLEENAFAPDYFAGTDDEGKPTWSRDLHEAAPVIASDSELTGLEGDPNEHPIRFNGSMSVSRIPAFGPERFRWMMVYGGRMPAQVDVHMTADDRRIGIFFRFARDPWGPWTPPRRLWTAFSEDGYGTLLYRPDYEGQPSDEDRGPRVCDAQSPFEDIGVEYSPQVLGEFSRVDGDALTVYWLLSTWNPYRVVQMKTTIALQ